MNTQQVTPQVAPQVSRLLEVSKGTGEGFWTIALPSYAALFIAR